MRIFEKISRRLAITLAGVMACSSFAMAPAITAFAADWPEALEGEDLKASKDNAKELKNETEDTVTLSNNGNNKVQVYKIKSDVEGKLKAFIEATDNAEANIVIYKSDDAKVSFPANDKLEKDKATEKTADVKEGEYFIAIANCEEGKELKFTIKVSITPSDIKTSKVGKVESPAKKTAKVTIKKAKKVDGYEICASTSKDFDKNVKTKAVKAKKVKFEKKDGTIEIKKLKSGKKYYVKVRTYIEKNGVKYYSDWSKSKKIEKVK